MTDVMSRSRGRFPADGRRCHHHRTVIEIAQTLVTIGVDLTEMNTIDEAERTLGFALTRNLDVHH